MSTDLAHNAVVLVVVLGRMPRLATVTLIAQTPWGVSTAAAARSAALRQQTGALQRRVRGGVHLNR
ncbi:MAG TPA: hypothetical protein VMW56_21205, partial [Candidatus Margulisiibacteriota bacterium]|nr:hypothetical protein [Candidatus Margulisiibacteriota bacterium]